jgi:Predicted ATPase with chaperone activity
MVGPPGAGKSMLAQRLPGLLPPLDPAAALEVSMIHSVAGQLAGGRLMRNRPFRDPHHSASLPSLIGGGQRAKPGEVSLAHHGVLFLDELPEFARATLESLRQPLESGRAVVARVHAHVTYPARFQLVAAMNPCRCGHIDDAKPRLRPRAQMRPGLSGEDLGPALRPHRHACGCAAVSPADLALPPPAKAAAKSPPASPRRARSRQRAMPAGDPQQ